MAPAVCARACGAVLSRAGRRRRGRRAGPPPLPPARPSASAPTPVPTHRGPIPARTGPSPRTPPACGPPDHQARSRTGRLALRRLPAPQREVVGGVVGGGMGGARARRWAVTVRLRARDRSRTPHRDRHSEISVRHEPPSPRPIAASPGRVGALPGGSLAMRGSGSRCPGTCDSSSAECDDRLARRTHPRGSSRRNGDTFRPASEHPFRPARRADSSPRAASRLPQTSAWTPITMGTDAPPHTRSKGPPWEDSQLLRA